MPYDRWKQHLGIRARAALCGHTTALPPARGNAAVVLVGVPIRPPFRFVCSTGISPALWGLLPFMLLTVAWAVAGPGNELSRSAACFEVLTLTRTTGTVICIRHNPRTGRFKSGICNRYWARPAMHAQGGPVPHYVTLTGDGPRSRNRCLSFRGRAHRALRREALRLRLVAQNI